MKQTIKQKLVLIGSGMVGTRFLERLLLEAPEQYDIRVFNKEPYGGYNRIMLSPVLAGEQAISDIMTHDHDWFKSHSIHLHTSTEISKIDSQNKTVHTDLGAVYSYDKLVIATGSTSFILPLPGNTLPGVVAFRDVRDVTYMIDSSEKKQNAVVIGGGLLGIEAANGLIKRGMNVTVVHRNEILMNMQMDKVSARLLRNSLAKVGMKFKLQAETVEILGTDHVTGVKFADGTQIDADLVVMAVGIKPNIAVAKKIGLKTNKGILINDQLETSHKDIYALGECVEHKGKLYGLVAPLYEQAQILALNLSGKRSDYVGSFISTKLKVTGISLFSAGDFHDSKETESIIYKDLSKQIYRKIVLKNNRIQGAILFGDVSGANWIFEHLNQQTDMSAFRDTMIFGEGFLPSTDKQEQKEKVA
ncbi:NAD(P)/FAD-dependent oxidoreductase [Thiomicrorhabdus sp.]|uniref:NAD(P)/FAD-dependent oxidoreductase n=1 Tax=Thiomicrorhabdus sp. TaxID=2039724 RepID=UPI002AA8B3D4|nr:FAD-dependent oxidoreductase [Thiomicrorhabdus sp.]